jgi:hypothetical protein
VKKQRSQWKLFYVETAIYRDEVQDEFKLKNLHVDHLRFTSFTWVDIVARLTKQDEQWNNFYVRHSYLIEIKMINLGYNGKLILTNELNTSVTVDKFQTRQNKNIAIIVKIIK